MGEDLAPIKDFPHEHQRIDEGGGGGRTKVELGMALSMHVLC